MLLPTELSVMDVTRELDEAEGSMPSVLVTDPPAPVSSSYPPCLKPNFSDEMVTESKAVSVARDECSSAPSSPDEASPAKPAVTPSILEQTLDQILATSQTASASDSVKSPGAGLLSICDPPPWVSTVPSTKFGCPEYVKDSPAVLTFQGVSITLENNSIWKEFCECGTEMILTKHGRRMFPYCRYRVTGLEPDRMYSLVLSIVPSSQFRYRWTTSKWEVSGPSEHQSQGLTRAFPHHYSPCLGSEWMSCLVSFYKLKLTNYVQDQEGHMTLHSMHRYIPRLHIIPVLDGEAPTADKPVLMGPESITFTFPQTEFMAVTTYQNFRITQLKINHNPFAKGFREDGNNSRLNRILPAAVKPETKAELLKPAEPSEQQEEVMDLSTKTPDASDPAANAQETKLVFKPIMSNTSGTGEKYVRCIRGKHALGEIVLLQNQLSVESKKEDCAIGSPKTNSAFWIPPKSRSNRFNSSTGTAGSATQFRKRKRKRIKRRWTVYYRKSWKTPAGAPKVAHNPLLTVAMQPETDDIEGLLFVSFTSKEALEVHVKDRLASSSQPSESELGAPMEMGDVCGVSVEENQETEAEKTARLESLLLVDLSVLKHRQVIHPVMQEVGLKLSSLDPTKAVDLKYLGVCLPPLPSSPCGHSSTQALSPADEELPFISRTGKTRDMTKIKGWRTKFSRSQETSASNSEGVQKNLSAFCSNMLDEYLENEAQQISERAAAFSMNPDDAVAYQLPARSSSYVKTLDSVLRHRNAASKLSFGANRPCPLSRKALPHSAQTSPADSPTPSGADPQRFLPSQSGANQRAGICFGQSQGPAHKLTGITPKILPKLMQMETAAFNQGLSRTHLTKERLSTALSAMTSEMSMPSEIPFGDDTAGPECGQEFCRLGCVCRCLKQPNRTADHCRQPDCMIACSCSQQPSGEPNLGSHPGKLWNRNVSDKDVEPLYTPQPAPSLPAVIEQKTWVYCPAPPVREEDKDPVYKYLESMLTCARVREFNSLPPPVLTLGTALFQQKEKAPPANVIKQENIAEATHQKPVETPPQDTSITIKGKKQIQIQSLCTWKQDRQMVLEGLFERMNQNGLHKRFYIGPYCVSPVTRVILKKPSGTVVTYRMQISKPKKASGCEDPSEGEEKCHAKHFYGKAEEELAMDSGRRYRMIPGGSLRARKKPSGFNASGLIQVNDKYYNHASLLLGNMGSLHPANRLAAHVTGRVRAPKTSLARLSTSSKSTPQTLYVKATNTFVPPVVDQKTTQQHRADLLKCLSDGSSNTVQDSVFQQNLHSSFTSSPVSLTVSPSLKSPSFLDKTGTYSFRICPPSTQAGAGQQPPGVALPGGFTLIQLVPPGAEKARELRKPPDVTTDTSVEKKEPVFNLNHLAREWVGFDTLSNVRTLLSSNLPEPNSSPGLLPEEKMPSCSSDAKDALLQMDLQYGLNFDTSSEELSSDFSDYNDCEDEDELVDIETVRVKEEAISKSREDALMRPQQSRDDYGQRKKHNMNADNRETRARRNHSAVEKLRRCEQRVLFDRLLSLLKLDSRSSRHSVLALAVKEIESLGKMSRYLQAEKTRQLEAQSVFLKKLSELAGKPESLIQSKLKEIFARQKQRERSMKWNPIFSNLLQSKAVLIQATAPPCDLKPSSPPHHDQNDLGQANTPEMAKDTLQKLLSLLPPSFNRLEKAYNQHIAPPAPETEAQQREPGPLDQPPPKLEENQRVSDNPGQCAMPSSDTNHPQVQDKGASKLVEATSESSGDKQATIVVPARTIALPLIRSKTGRLILPSSLKPIGQGYYTLMFLESTKNKEGDEASSSATAEPSPADSFKTSEQTASASDQPSDSVSKNALIYKASPSQSDPKTSGEAHPRALLALLNKSISSPQLNLQCTATNQGDAVPVLFRTSTGQVCSKPVGQVRPSVKQDCSSASVKLDGGRPSLKESNVTVDKMRRRIPVKQGRGRPARKIMAPGRGPAVKRARSQNTDDDDTPVKYCIASLKSPNSSNSQQEAYTSRPQTRGSLGKDFPSAKKRSWIDVEKELEPDLDSV